MMVLYLLVSFIGSALISDKDSVVVSAQLQALYEPEPVKFSFQTPGWYILAGVLLIIVLFLLVRWTINYKKNAYRREALKNLEAIQARFRQNNDISCVNDTLVLLKLVAIQTFGRQTVAELYGDKWIQFLEDSGKDTPFRKHASALFSVAYNKKNSEEAEVNSIFDLTKKWIKTHA